MEEGADGYCDNGSGARQWQGRGREDVGELSEVGEGRAIFSARRVPRLIVVPALLCPVKFGTCCQTVTVSYPGELRRHHNT